MVQERSATPVAFTTRNRSASGSSPRVRPGQSSPTIENEFPTRLGPRCRYHIPLPTPHPPVLSFLQAEFLNLLPYYLFFHGRNTQRSRQTLDCLLH